MVSSTDILYRYTLPLSGVCTLIHLARGTRELELIEQLFRFMRFQRLVLFAAIYLENLKNFYYIVKNKFQAFRGISNVLYVLFVILFVFSTMGTQLFGKVAYYNSYSPNANFRSFYRSILVLIRIATLDNWNIIMYDASHHKKNCVVDPPYDPRYCGFSDHVGCLPLNGCGDLAIFPFVLIYVLLMGFVAFNLFVSTVLRGFEEEVGNSRTMRTEYLFKFVSQWSQFDPLATCLLKSSKLKSFVANLFEPLGFGGAKVDSDVLRERASFIRAKMPKPYKGYYHFQDVLRVLSALLIKETKVPDVSDLSKSGSFRSLLSSDSFKSSSDGIKSEDSDVKCQNVKYDADLDIGSISNDNDAVYVKIKADESESHQDGADPVSSWLTAAASFKHGNKSFFS